MNDYFESKPRYICPYLLQGKLRYQIGEEFIDLESGEYICIPENKPHAWINLYPEPARIVAVLAPGGSEGFFQTVSSASLEPEAMMKLAREYGTEILGAPLAESITRNQPT